MKKICRTIKLKKYKTQLMDEDWIKSRENNAWIIIFSDWKATFCWDKNELYKYLENDHIKPIQYIFDTIDKITIDRDVIINTDELFKEK